MTYPRDPFAMAAKIGCRHGNAELPARSLSANIAAFLDGGTDGEELLHALYDHVLDEPIPYSMRRILREPLRQVR
jgi:hypothetical protein